MKKKVNEEVERLKRLAGILSERWSDDEEGDAYDNYANDPEWQDDNDEEEGDEFDPFGNQSYLDLDDDDFSSTITGKKKRKSNDADIENSDNPYDFSDLGLDDKPGDGGSSDFDFNFDITDSDEKSFGSLEKNGGDLKKAADDGKFTIGGDSPSGDTMGFSGNLDDYVSKFLPQLQKDRDAKHKDAVEKNKADAADRAERNVAIDKRTGEEKSKSRSTGMNNKSQNQREKEAGNKDVKNEYSLYEIYMNQTNESNLGAAYAERELDGDASRQMHEEVDFLDLKDGQDVWVKSKKAYAVIIDLDSPSSPDTGEDPHVIVKLRNGEELDVPVTDIEIHDDPESGDGEHYGDEEDDKSYYQSRGWKSSMEEEQDPQAKMNKLVGLEEGSKSDFEKFMSAMGQLYGLSNNGFITPEEWKQIFPVYTAIYTRAKDMDVKNFKNDK